MISQYSSDKSIVGGSSRSDASVSLFIFGTGSIVGDGNEFCSIGYIEFEIDFNR